MIVSRIQHVKILYKLILKLHRGLPNDIKLLGDAYVKNEFKQHKNCNDAEAFLFLNEWTSYALQLASQLNIKNTIENTNEKIGHNIEPKLINNLNDDQVVQLYELMKAAKHIDKEKNTNK